MLNFTPVIWCCALHCCCVFVRLSSVHGTSQFSPLNMLLGFAQYPYFCITLLSVVMLIVGHFYYTVCLMKMSAVKADIFTELQKLCCSYGPGMVRCCQSCNNV